MSAIAFKKPVIVAKRDEITRLLEVMALKKLSSAALARITDIPKQAIEDTIIDNQELDGALLRALHLNLGVSIDWIVDGAGSMFADNRSDNEPIMPFYENIDAKNMQDFWYLMALIAEKSLIQSGAVPHIDYSIMDLYKISQPFVLSKFNEKELDLLVYE